MGRKRAKGPAASLVRNALKKRQWTSEDAGVVLAAWEASSLSLGAFAKKHGLVAERLVYWRKRRRARKTKASEKRGSDPLRLLPVIASAAKEERRVEVVVTDLAAGVRVEVGEVASVSPSWIAEVAWRLRQLAS